MANIQQLNKNLIDEKKNKLLNNLHELTQQLKIKRKI